METDILTLIALVTGWLTAVVSNILESVDKKYREVDKTLKSEIAEKKQKVAEELTVFFKSFYTTLKENEGQQGFFEEIIQNYSAEFREMNDLLKKWYRIDQLRKNYTAIKNKLTVLIWILIAIALLLAMIYYYIPNPGLLFLEMFLVGIIFLIPPIYRLWLERTEQWVINL